MKKEAQERLMGDVGGKGKYNATHNHECEMCNDKFVNEANVMIHIISVHEKEVRKIFVIDASEHLEADREYHMWMNAITDVNKDKDVIKDLENTNRVLLKRVNEENKHTYKKLSENKGIIETERMIYSEDGKTKKGVVKEQFAKVTKRKSFDASLPENAQVNVTSVGIFNLIKAS